MLNFSLIFTPSKISNKKNDEGHTLHSTKQYSAKMTARIENTGKRTKLGVLRKE